MRVSAIRDSANRDFGETRFGNGRFGETRIRRIEREPSGFVVVHLVTCSHTNVQKHRQRTGLPPTQKRFLNIAVNLKTRNTGVII